MQVRTISVLNLCILFGMLGEPAATVEPATRDAVGRLVGSIVVEGRAYDYDHYLADRIGPRLTGSAAYETAVSWAIGQFRAIGLSNVHTEAFRIPSLWEPETLASGRMLSPRTQSLHIKSLGWSPSTPPGGVRGPIFFLPDLFATDKLKETADEIRGNIVLVDRSEEEKPAILWGKVADRIQLLKELGARAVVLGGTLPNNVESTTALTLNGSLSPLPVAILGKEDVGLLHRLSDEGPVEIEFSFTNRIGGSAEVDNVVAEIRGRERPDEWVVVGGHLDSWQPGTGAQDNGTGAASVIETARALVALERPPRYSVRFILFGGEEQGLLGSQAYVRAHVAELAECRAVLITDTGAEPAHGWLVFGRADIKQSLHPLEPLLEGLGGQRTSDDPQYIFDSDQAPFLVKGIPSLMLWTDMDRYNTIHHKPGDTFDKVDKHTLSEGAAIMAATAYAVADSQTFAGHLSAQRVDDLLKQDKKYKEYLDLREHGVF